DCKSAIQQIANQRYVSRCSPLLVTCCVGWHCWLATYHLRPWLKLRLSATPSTLMARRTPLRLAPAFRGFPAQLSPLSFGRGRPTQQKLGPSFVTLWVPTPTRS